MDVSRNKRGCCDSLDDSKTSFHPVIEASDDWLLIHPFFPDRPASAISIALGCHQKSERLLHSSFANAEQAPRCEVCLKTPRRGFSC